MILNKIDLLPHLDFDLARAVANARQVNPEIASLCVSARTGEGFENWYEWLGGKFPMFVRALSTDWARDQAVLGCSASRRGGDLVHA